MSNAPRRERKVVTVVFCDLVGFTARAESMDPEDVEALLGPYHERVRAELERHGGTVEKFIGDAVMALFGAPTAHEDDPERAVRAALAIREFALEEQLELRVGITTGEALVRLDAQPGAGEGMASGDVVNTAARLQSGAPVNGILVDETTYRATRQAIEYDAAETVEAKGKAAPVPVWRVDAARSRFGVDVEHHARTELVGRERELGLLRDAFDRARHGRVPQLVTLVGVPGMGKSRLLYELSRFVDADPELVTWRQGRCLAYGDGVTMWALGEIVKAQVGILEQDSEDVVAEKIRRAVEDVVGGSGDEARVTAHLCALAGISGEGELGGDRRNEAFSAWRAFIEAIAEQRPLVLVFEDLHWADEVLLDFVDELVDWVTDVPLLVVATARPELLERRPGWGGGKLNATTLALSPLSDEQTATLLGRLLGRSVLPADSQRALLERAGGNPLYAEQFADLYVERGSADELPLPESLQGIIAARLDSLSQDEKRVLQHGAVVGKVFWASALANGADDVSPTLHSLERKSFLRRQKRSSIEGELEYAFAHALVRDVAYAQIARADRAERHRQVAEWIESLGRPEDHAEMRAYHWRSALELARASGTSDTRLEESARLALRAAGDRAYSLNSFATAAARFDDALALWSNDDPDRPDLLFRYARALVWAYDEERREQALEEARDALLAAGDAVRAGEAEAFLARVAWDRGQSDLVGTRLERAKELVGDEASPAAARVLATSARMLIIAEEASHAQEVMGIAESALTMAGELGLAELQAHSLATRGMAKNALEAGSGVDDMEQALELALAADSPVASAIVNNLAVDALVSGDIRRADELYAEAFRLAERFGDAASMRFIRGNRIWAGYARGRWDDSLADANVFVAECEAGSPHTQEVLVRQVRGEIRHARGDPTGALEDGARALTLAREQANPGALTAGISLRAAMLAELGRTEEARALADELAPVVRDFGPHGSLATVAAVLAEELGLAADLQEALDHGPRSALVWRSVLDSIFAGDLSGGAELLSSMGSQPLAARVRLYAGRSLIARGESEDGVRELEQALAFYRSVGAAYFVERCEALLAPSAQRDSA